MNYICDEDGNIYNANGRKMRLQLHRKGYLYFTESNAYKYPETGKKTWRVNRYVYQYFNPDVDMTGMDVDHINGIKTDNRISNLELVTSKQNNRRRDYVKLDEYKVAMMRSQYKTGDYSLRKLAEMYDVHYSHVSDIINYKLWT